MAISTKNQITRTRQNPSLKFSTSRKFDLEERTFNFAKKVRLLLKKLPKTISNIEDFKQLTRSSGSIGANYIEANEALGRNDFFHKLRISRKESKESRYWLKLLDINESEELEKLRVELINEATEYICIFSSMIKKAGN